MAVFSTARTAMLLIRVEVPAVHCIHHWFCSRMHRELYAVSRRSERAHFAGAFSRRSSAAATDRCVFTVINVPTRRLARTHTRTCMRTWRIVVAARGGVVHRPCRSARRETRAQPTPATKHKISATRHSLRGRRNVDVGSRSTDDVIDKQHAAASAAAVCRLPLRSADC